MASNFLGHNLSYEAAPQYLQCTINISNYYLFTGPSSLVFILKKLKRDNSSSNTNGTIPQIEPGVNPNNYSDRFYYGTDISSYDSCEELPQFKHEYTNRFQSLFPYISLTTCCKPRITENDLCTEVISSTKKEVNTATVITLFSSIITGYTTISPTSNGIKSWKKNVNGISGFVNPVYATYLNSGTQLYWADAHIDPEGIFNSATLLQYRINDPIVTCDSELDLLNVVSFPSYPEVRAWQHTCVNPCVFVERAWQSTCDNPCIDSVLNFNQCRYVKNQGQVYSSPYGQTRVYGSNHTQGINIDRPYFDPTTAVISAYP